MGTNFSPGLVNCNGSDQEKTLLIHFIIVVAVDFRHPIEGVCRLGLHPPTVFAGPICTVKARVSAIPVGLSPVPPKLTGARVLVADALGITFTRSTFNFGFGGGANQYIIHIGVVVQLRIN